MEALHGLSTINIELTSRCNKSCFMCGRRKIEKEYPEIAKNWGDMQFSLVERIAEQLPPNIVVQFHNNGEPLLYPRFGEAVKLFKNQIRCADTNGKLLVEKADEIIDNLHTVTISVVEDDPDAEKQYRLVKKFLKIKGKRPPLVVVRVLGKNAVLKWLKVGIYKVAMRTLHDPQGSFRYRKPRVIPETGICLDALHHPAIDRYGNLSACVRFDPGGMLRYGNLNASPLAFLWNEVSRAFKEKHIAGQRKELPVCKTCEYWGCPS